MNKQKVKLKKVKNSKSYLIRKDNKRRLNYLFNHELFQENNNFILRLLKRSQMLPDKISLMKRAKNSINENDKNNENDYKKDKVELTYEIDDILYNNSKSFSKSKNKYFKIKKENDEFLEFYKFNKHHKSKSMNTKKHYNYLSKNNDKNEIEIIEDDDDHCYDAFNNDDYLLIKEQDDIFFHFLNKSQNERKYYRFQGPYKYINKMKKYINTKSFDINDNDNNNVISGNQNKKNFIRKKEKHKNKTMSIKDKSRNGNSSLTKNKKIKFDIIKGNNFKTIRINSKDKYSTNSFFSNMENIKTHKNLNINNLRIYNNMSSSNKNLVNMKEKKNINLSNKHLNQHHENNDKFEIFNNIKKGINNNKSNNTLNFILNDNSNIIDNNNINSDIKNKDKTKFNLKRGLITNFSNDKKNYKINKSNIKNKINFRNKICINNEKTYNRNNFFNKALKSFTKSKAQNKALDNNNIVTINASRNNNKIKLKIKNNKLSEYIYSKNINVNKSNLNHYISNLNKHKTINVSTNINSNKIFDILQKISNSSSIENINNMHNNKNMSQNLLMKKNKKNKENNFDKINDVSSIIECSNKTLNKERKRWMLGLFKEQKDKLSKKNERSIPNIRRRTYDKLIFYNKDLFSRKERKNNDSFLTDPNNLNYSKILDKKHVINLNNLVDDIKSKNKDNKIYQFLRDQLYNNKILKKIEKANIYLSNLDKHFIKKYTQFQTLISNEDDI